MTIVNDSNAIHPMHLHGHHMLVLSRNGVPDRGSPWWSDTLQVDPGVRYVVAFRADNPGVWMDHCHNLGHAAAGLTMHVMYAGVYDAVRRRRAGAQHAGVGSPSAHDFRPFDQLGRGLPGVRSRAMGWISSFGATVVAALALIGTSAASDPPQVTVIGDSVLTAVEWNNTPLSLLEQGLDVQLDIGVCRTLEGSAVRTKAATSRRCWTSSTDSARNSGRPCSSRWVTTIRRTSSRSVSRIRSTRCWPPASSTSSGST